MTISHLFSIEIMYMYEPCLTHIISQAIINLDISNIISTIKFIFHNRIDFTEFGKLNYPVSQSGRFNLPCTPSNLITFRFIYFSLVWISVKWLLTKHFTFKIDLPDSVCAVVCGGFFLFTTVSVYCSGSL
jgi:hypothetical protein